MSEKKGGVEEIEGFLEGWQKGEGTQAMRRWFELFYRELQGMDGVQLSFIARPGVSYSIRPKHQHQTDRELFAIVDVIDDDPDQRWLSVCFYEDMITDPETLGELIPGGLAGGDGYCFDLFEDDENIASYLQERLREAARSAQA